jgi:hypothetical protein
MHRCFENRTPHFANQNLSNPAARPLPSSPSEPVYLKPLGTGSRRIRRRYRAGGRTAFEPCRPCSSRCRAFNFPVSAFRFPVFPIGRADRIRTCDLLNPIQAHYQAVLRPDQKEIVAGGLDLCKREIGWRAGCPRSFLKNQRPGLPIQEPARPWKFYYRLIWCSRW